MLEKIHEESWGEFRVLTGTAEQIPQAVLGLLSRDKKSFESAYWKIENYVVVQGDLFSAAAILPKYLYEVVLETKYKERIIDLIWEIGTGHSKDRNLQEQCFTESVKAYEMLLVHPKIASTKYCEMVKNELNDMLVFDAERQQKS